MLIHQANQTKPISTIIFLIEWLLLLSIKSGHAQQVQLRGSVAMHNSKYQTGEVIYVPNTYLSAPFTNPGLTDAKGIFTLEFVGLDPGMAMKIEASKEGLEIVNTRDLLEVVIGRRLPLRIYVTEKGNLAKAQMELFKVSQRALFAGRDQMIARLRGEKAQSEAAMEELQKRFGQALKDRFAAEDLLRKKVEEQQKQLPKFAMDLAEKNLDNASALYIEAYKLFREGKILEVIALLDQEKLQASRQQTKQATAAIKKEKALLAAREEQNQQQIQQLISTFTLKADALALEFRYAAVAAQYQEIIGIHLENDLPKKALARWYDKLGEILNDNGTYPAALEVFEKALAIRELLLDAKDPLLATSYNNIGNTYAFLGRYEASLTFHQKALAIHEEVLDGTHPDIVNSYNHVGATYSHLGKHQKALAFHQKALFIQEKVLGVNHPDLASLYTNIGATYSRMGQLKKALDFQQKVISIHEKVLDAKHPLLAVSYDNIGVTYANMGNDEKALVFQRKALAIREEVLDTKHPDLAFSYNNIGLTLQYMGKYHKALAFQQKGLTIFEEVLEAKHPSLAASYNNIGNTYSSMGNPKKALDFQQKAVKIQKEVLGARHPNMAAFYHNIGRSYSSMGNHQYALEFYKKTLDILNEKFDPRDLSFAISYDSKARALMGLQQYRVAQKYLQKALAIFKEKKHPRIITTYGHMGLLQLKMGNTSKAKEYFSLYNELAKDKDKALGTYYEALYHSTVGDHSKALGFLEEAVAKGYQNKVGITQEELLAPLHGEPRYQVLVEKLLKEND